MRNAANLVAALCAGVFAHGCGGSGGDDGNTGDPPLVSCDPADGESLPAFPGAQGFGAIATGGRGGQVIKVTTLDASGPGSLQEALDQDGPRIIVFEVSGVIEGDIEIRGGDVTIAGQTAPGGGITIAGRLIADYDFEVGNIIIRHLRIRPEYDGSDGSQFDSLFLSRNPRVIVDHVSVAFGVDETIDLYEAQDVTIQWSIIESSGTEGHPEGDHNYGLINGPDGGRISVHHNLFAHHLNRNPALATGPAEMRNNVVYNAGNGFVHHNPAVGEFNLVGNYFKTGPESDLVPFFFDDENGFSDPGLSYYVNDNFIEGGEGSCDGPIDDPWASCEVLYEESIDHRSTEEHTFSQLASCTIVTTTSSAAAFDEVLDFAGAYPRDVVSTNSVDDTRNGTGQWGAYVVPDLMEGLTTGTPPEDADDDGMADDWELDHGLDPANGDDHGTVMESGYTAIEDYINELAAELSP
jgi:pectate lyase